MISCCIDKTSSAELTEAINSMFRWYKSSEVCYVYLSDVSSCDYILEQFKKARWFQRGWTLQELIAPDNVIFHSKEWHQFGTKAGLSAFISDITNIDPLFLDSENLASASIAQKMSWASKRETSRPEDIAYCLLGIFDVNMPLIYGEGSKAFLRLQEEIITTYPYDFTIFAWGELASECAREIKDIETRIGDKPLKLESFDPKDDHIFGLLAESPRDYTSSGLITLPPDSKQFFRHEAPIQHRNKNVISLRLATEPYTRVIASRHPQLGSLRMIYMQYAILPCGCGTDSFKFVLIPLVIPNFGISITGRIRQMIIAVPFTSDRYSCLGLRFLKKMHTVAPLTRYRSLEAGDIIFRRRSQETSCRSGFNYSTSYMLREDIIARGNAVDTNLFNHLVFGDQNMTFCIVLRVNSSPDTPYGVLYFRFYRVPLPYDEAIKLQLAWYSNKDFLCQQGAVPFSSQTPTIDMGPDDKARVGSERIYIDDDPASPVDLVDIVVVDKNAAPHWWPQSPESHGSLESWETYESSESSFCLDTIFGNQSIQELSQHEPEGDEHVNTMRPVSTPSGDGFGKLQGGDALPRRIAGMPGQLVRRRSI